MSTILNPDKKTQVKGEQEIREELKSTLSESEYNALEQTIFDAYFTPYSVIDGIHNIAGKLGIHKNASILEPSCGSGFFIGLIARMEYVLENYDDVELLADEEGNLVEASKFHN